MKKYLIGIFICGLVILVSLFVLREISYKTYKNIREHVELAYVSLQGLSAGKKTDDSLPLKKLVAHAGGGLDNLTYINSLEALNVNYRNGFRFIEIDLVWTSDGHLVLIHDWNKTVSRLFNVPPRCYSLKEFKKMKMINGMTALSLDDLSKWMSKHPDVFIITDVKSDNGRALAMIREDYPELVKNFIPQIYYFYEYFPVRDLGFSHIILTLYRTSYSDQAILKFAKKYHLIAVTMWFERAQSDLPKELREIGTPTYAYTVNDSALEQVLYNNGVFGVYTDFITP